MKGWMKQWQCESGGRCPLHSQHKTTGDSFPIDRNSRMKIAERLKAGRLGPTQTTHFFKSGDLSDHTRTEDAHWKSKGSYIKDIPYPYAFSLKSILAKRSKLTHGRILDISNMDCEPGKLSKISLWQN